MSNSDIVTAVKAAIQKGELKPGDFQAALAACSENITRFDALIRQHIFNIQLITGRACG